MTALDHLRKLVATGCERAKGIAGDPACFYCNGDWNLELCERHARGENIDPYIHSPDCPWVAAKEFVETYDLAMRSGGLGVTTNAHLEKGGWHALPVTFEAIEDGLLPCPFCGAQAGIRDEHAEHIHFGVCCSRCFGELASAFQSAEAAVKAWNRREG